MARTTEKLRALQTLPALGVKKGALFDALPQTARDLLRAGKAERPEPAKPAKPAAASDRPAADK